MRAFPVALVAVILVAAPALAQPEIGKPAPDFKLNDANGRVVSLSEFRGKTVVLEWNNPQCPFVLKHYMSGNMQKTQGAAAADGAVWLTVNSNAPGTQGHMNGAQAKSFVAAARARPAAYLLDPKGVVGRSYKAKTTPHMYIVNPTGDLVYMGAIDSMPSTEKRHIRSARNHVLAALSELKEGKAVSVSTTRPYGCSVKY